MNWKLCIGILAGALLIAGVSLAQGDKSSSGAVLANPFVDISGQWFLAYQVSDLKTKTTNTFTLKRGYLTFKKEFNKTFSVRFTQDITLDREGSDAGNIEMRLKYLYLKVNMQWIPWLSNSWIEAGMVHRPWLDFEEHVNDFRVQGPMFAEANELINSADFGFNLVTLLGGKLSKEQSEKVGNFYPGRYGSFSIGLFNGGGYHAIEQNTNKTLESRLTIRPLPDLITGLQASYHLVAGTGYSEKNPGFLLNHLALTHESPHVIFVGQWLFGKGNAFGTFFQPDGEPASFRGLSAFGEVFVFRRIVSVFGEYSYFNKLEPATGYTRKMMAGVSARFLNDQKILFDTEYFTTQSDKRLVYELALEIRF